MPALTFASTPSGSARDGTGGAFLSARISAAVAFGAGLLIAAFSGSALAALTVGKPAPDFQLQDSAGKTRSLSEFRGKVVVLEWTNHDCPFVVKHYGSGNMQALQREATANGAVWLQVISSAPGEQGHVDGKTAAAIVAERKAAPTATLLDPTGTVGKAFGARTTPHMYIIDKAGTLSYMGGIDDKPTANPADIPGARNFVRLALAEVAAGKPVTEAVTRPYGCSVKY